MNPAGLAQLLEDPLGIAEDLCRDEDGSLDLERIAQAVPHLAKLARQARKDTEELRQELRAGILRRGDPDASADFYLGPERGLQVLAALAVCLTIKPGLATLLSARLGAAVPLCHPVHNGGPEDLLFRTSVLGDSRPAKARIGQWNTISDRWVRHQDIMWPD